MSRHPNGSPHETGGDQSDHSHALSTIDHWVSTVTTSQRKISATSNLELAGAGLHAVDPKVGPTYREAIAGVVNSATRRVGRNNSHHEMQKADNPLGTSCEG